jgi:hypothetical protein
MDHKIERIEPARRKIEKLKSALSHVPGLEFSPWPETLVDGVGYHQLGIRVYFANKTPEQVAEMNRRLRDGDPSIWLYYHGGTSLEINTLYLAEG